jgi:hypothetical protein
VVHAYSNVTRISDIYTLISSIKDRPVCELLELVRHHDIEVETQSEGKIGVLRMKLMRHLLKGSCYTCTAEGCKSISSRTRDCREHLRSVFNFVVTTPGEEAEKTRVVACKSLGLNPFSKKGNADNYSLPLQYYIDSLALTKDSLFLLRRLDTYTMTELLSIARAHRIDLTGVPKPTSELLKTLLVQHVVKHGCSVNTDLRLPPKCEPVAASEAYGQTLLRFAVSSKLGRRPLSYLVWTMGLPVNTELSVGQLRSAVTAYLNKVEKSPEDRPPEPRLQHPKLRAAWPPELKDEVLDRFLHSFVDATSSAALKEMVCGVCGGMFQSKHMHPLPVSFGSFNNDLLRPKTRLPHAMPTVIHDHPVLTGLVVNKKGLKKCDSIDPEIDMCKKCYQSIIRRNKMPTLALANDLYLGPIPEELKDLTMAEEALIARRRAKMWVVHLKGDSESAGDNASAVYHQRGLRGHVIVYPADPNELSKVLPPSLETMSTPVCVVFVGDKPPSREWLLEKAKPLVVCTERVRRALVWLKANNPLYRDIAIDHDELNSWPPGEHVLPVNIEVQSPNRQTETEGSRYDEPECGTCMSTDCMCKGGRAHEHFQNVVVTDVDVNTASSAEMKAAALRHLKSGKAFIRAGHASDPVNEYEDETLFPLLYPTLFPYGRGGFEVRSRFSTVSMRTQAKHFFQLSDQRFREHYSFLFVVFNILQRRAVSLGARLKIKHKDFPRFAEDIDSVSPEALDAILQAKSDGRPVDVSRASQIVDRLLRNVKVVTSKVPGTTSARISMRNEIRGMMLEHGLPSFYITINPADVYNPIVKFMAGDDIDVDNLLDKDIPEYQEQRILLARNPFLGAKFFNVYMEAFFRYLIGPVSNSGPSMGGVLGMARAYYGCVEAQGRGTLHCHMLVWLEGALDPHDIATKIVEERDEDFRDRLVKFIDQVIHNGLPDAPPPENLRSKHHPCSTRSRVRTHARTSVERRTDLAQLVKACQAHKHRNTCYKYDPSVCRFDLDENNYVPETVIDSNTGEITYRVLQGLINNYNPTILEAVRCNMDIKFIGSGLSAKGILYYITDYITKSPLKTEVGYAAIQKAIERLYEKIQEQPMSSSDRARTLLVKCANQLVAKQQLSAPQVASYLCDYGDHYSSHRFKPLFWTSFESYVDKLTPPSNRGGSTRSEQDTSGDATDEDWNEDVPLDEEDLQQDEVLLGKTDDDRGLETQPSQCTDYLLRGKGFESISLWDFVAGVNKNSLRRMKCDSPTAYQRLLYDEERDEDDEDDDDESSLIPSRSSVKNFFLQNHPQSKSHALHSRRIRLVPVPIGPALPRRDRPDMYERYCKLMLIFFKPWRNLSDLKEGQDTWELAFNNFRDSAEERVLRVIENMQRLHECRDSRDRMYIERRIQLRGHEPPDRQRMLVDDNSDDDEAPSSEDVLRTVSQGIKEIDATMSNRRSTEKIRASAAVRALTMAGMLEPESDKDLTQADLRTVYDQLQTNIEGLEETWRKEYSLRRTLEDNENAEIGDVNMDMDLAEPRGEGSFTTWTLEDSCSCAVLCTAPPDPCYAAANKAMVATADKFCLNEEQRLAYKIICEASFLPQVEPLLMYMGGPGGTGKSTVIKAVKRFFQVRGQRGRLKLAAYTGIAAKHIGGATLHALLCMRQLYPDASIEKRASGEVRRKLNEMWRKSDFLFIDEVSMLGCEMLYKVNSALQTAKSSMEPFGGVNVLFAGDFAQLAPVGDCSLYTSHGRLLSSENSQKPRGQARVAGKALWLQTNSCVMFDRLMRQAGDENESFRELLGRSREGRCNESDYEMLKDARFGLDECADQDFKHAPVITPLNSVNDELNQLLAKRFAEERGQQLDYFWAVDKYDGIPVPPGTELETTLTTLHSGRTEHLMQCLPLTKGMPVYLTQNYDVETGIVNGAYGEIRVVNYRSDSLGRKYATSCVLYMPDYRGPRFQGLHEQEVVVLPEKKTFSIRASIKNGAVSIERTQLPLQPAFAMTDFKSQGRTLARVILDLSCCSGSQSPYVMLSRATSIKGIRILQDFPLSKIRCRPSEDLRREQDRLKRLFLNTKIRYGTDVQRREAVAALASLPDIPPPRRLDQGQTSSCRTKRKRCSSADHTASNAVYAALEDDDS